MLIEFIRPWAHYEPGQTIDPPAGQAELMIQRGIAKAVVKQEKPKPQKATTK